MAKLVTRTVLTYTHNIAVLERDGDVFRARIAGTVDTDKKVLGERFLKNWAKENGINAACTVLSTDVHEKLYGVSVEKFMEIAEELPPRASKAD